MQTQTQNQAQTQTTTLGTPCSPNWDDDWIQEVNDCEQQLGHRCCGAHAPDEEPCILQSTHKNGRCRFHGGAKNIGAPKGNTNARIHGLYMRRIQQCGSHCPLWNTCPMKGKDVLDTPETKRPLCIYEQDELNILREIDQSVQKIDKPGSPIWYDDDKTNHPLKAQLTMLKENINILQIMITRATKVLQLKGTTSETIQQTSNNYIVTDKPSAAVQALRILSHEHRQTINTYTRIVKIWGLPTHIQT